IEPLAGGPLEVGACERDRIPGLPPPAPAAAAAAPRAVAAPAAPAAVFVPQLRCTARGASGRRLVRILYVVPELDYPVTHDIAMTRTDSANVAARFSIATPAWQQRAEVALFEGMPGEQKQPREIARGTVMLDGGIALIATAPRAMPARLRRIYDGAVHRRTDI